MGEKHFVTAPLPGGVRFRWQGTIDFGELYRFMKWWWQDNGFCDNDGFTENDQSIEKKFVERRLQGGVRNVEIEWAGSQCPKGSDYFRHHIAMTILILGMREQEVELRGAKRNLDRGDFDIRMHAFVETGFSPDWDKSVFKQIYYKFIIQKRLQLHKRELYILFYRFQNAVKDYIQNQRY